jgi:signal transduction histidine kinase
MNSTSSKSVFFSLIKKLKTKSIDSLRKQVNHVTNLINNNEEVSQKSLLAVIQQQQQIIDFIVDDKDGLYPHIQQLDNYRQLGLKGLSFIASSHEINSIFMRFSAIANKQTDEFNAIKTDIDRLEQITSAHIGQHSTYRREKRMNQANLKAYIENIFKGYKHTNIEFVNFNQPNLESYMKTDKGFTIISNLVSNALYWGDKVEIKWIDDKIIVSDSGKGIPEDKQDQLFNIGFSERTNGHGLGLLMSREYARESNAALYFDKECKHTTLTGASFVLDLNGKIDKGQ